MSVKFGLGQPVRRLEDDRLLRGRGRFTDDIDLPGQAYAVVVRSPHAHARISSVETAAALASPGVLAVFTGDDVAADGLGDLPCLFPAMVPLTRADGAPMFVPPRPMLVRDFVRMPGDYVALVVAMSVEEARDAAERVAVEYEALAALTDAGAARAEGAPVVWDECADNVCFHFETGDREAVERAFAGAAHKVALDYRVSRVAINPMEPRAAIGAYDAAEDRYTLYTGTQGAHDLRRFMAGAVLKIQESRLRVVSPDMGGAFGLRSGVFPELPLVLWASRRLGRPVKWTAERGESFLCDDHARDSLWSVELALDADGLFLGLRAEQTAAMGAYLSLFGPVPAFLNLGGLAGVYRTPAIFAEVNAVFTNTPPIAPYRGAGRPEASLAIEMAIDAAAREMGLDRVGLRRRNLIAPEHMPYQTPLSYRYDCGEFERNMDMALALADHAGFEARRAESAARGRLRGFGLANAIEQSAGGFEEYAQLRFDPDGGATLSVGTHSHGQGHETVFKQLLAEQLGLEPDAVRFVQGDTDLVPYGHGTFGSRSSGAGGAAIAKAAERIVDKCRLIAAHHFETAAADMDFSAGEFRVVGTDRRIALRDVARMAFMRPKLPPGMEPGLQADGAFVPPAPTFPNGCHACEVEIDPETGTLEIVRYCVVDDVGTVMNPLLLGGQIHGGAAQGLGQVMMEQVVWDDGGQLLTGSFLDYAMPRADHMPAFELDTNPVPTPTNPLGIKGAGEAGCVGALPCLTSAIADALAQVGARAPDMPATPEKLWRALRAARPDA